MSPLPASVPGQPQTHHRFRLPALSQTWQDLVIIAAFLIVSALAYHGMFRGGDYLPLAYGDWIAHAYRALFMQEHGLATWDHNWAGGLSLFQTYQFLPTAVTAVFSSLTHASIGRSMLLLEACLLVPLSPSAYVAARALRLPPVAALLAGVITLGLNNYASAATTFSALWGLALLSPLIVAVYRWRDSPAIYPIAALCGLAIYVHPHLALCGVLALVSAWLLAPAVRRLPRLGLEAACTLLASTFYWLPTVFSARPRIQDQYSASAGFMRFMFHGEIHNFSPLAWIALVAVPLSLVLLWRFARAPLARYLVTFCALLIALIALSYYGIGPESFRIMQNVRLLIVIPLALGLLAAVSADAGLRAASCCRYRKGIVPAGIVGLALVAALPLTYHAAHHPYGPAWFGADPLNDWLAANDSSGRIWFGDLQTPWYTYQQLDRVRSSESHFPVGEWSILKTALDDGMLSGQDFDVTAQYLKAMDVSYVALPYGQPLEVNLRDGAPLFGRLQMVAQLPSAAIYETPWQPVGAFLTDAASLPDLRFPDTISAASSEHTTLDPLVRRYNDLAYSSASSPVAVDYPSPATMQVHLPSLATGQYLVISENWDVTWHARTARGEDLPVERYGPNYIGVDLSGLSGEVTLDLEHGMSRDWQAGILLTLLALPASLAIAAYDWRRKMSQRRAVRRSDSVAPPTPAQAAD